MMFDHLIDVNNLQPEFEINGLNEKDIVFIKEQIAGQLEDSQQSNVSGEKGGVWRDKKQCNSSSRVVH